MRVKFLVLLPVFFAAASFADCPNPTLDEVREELLLRKSSAEKLDEKPVEKSVEKVTSNGRKILKPRNITPLRCERPLVYRGEVYSADAPQVQDASTLKRLVEPVPEAASIVSDYQNTREKSKISAYTGTLGIVMFIFSNQIANRFAPESRESIHAALRSGGLAIAAGGFVYSLALLRSNEYLLPKAVDTYNQAKPDDPIELHFSAGWSF